VVALRANVPSGDIAARARGELSGYYAHIEATDRALGRLLDDLPGDTVAIFASVHGDMHGSHGLFRKGWPHEESTRVPLLVRMPGASGRIDAPVSLVELPRMITGLSEGRPPAASAGPSRISMPSVVALPDQCDRTWSGLRWAERKIVLNADGTPWLFFDLDGDPLELTNLAAEPSHAREIRDLAARVRS
jgi:arylsulfatase A-like enzyme